MLKCIRHNAFGYKHAYFDLLAHDESNFLDISQHRWIRSVTAPSRILNSLTINPTLFAIS